MADITSQFAFSENPRSGFQRVLASMGRGFSNVVERHSRRAQIAALEARSDAELASIGLKREDIARHVFRDIAHI